MKGLWLKHSAWASVSIGPSFIVLINLCLIWSYLQDVQNKVFRLGFKETVLEFETKEKTSVHLKWFLDKPQPRTSLKLARFYSDLKVQNISLKLWITWAPWVRGIFLKCNFNVHILSSSSLLLLVILGLKVDNLNLFKLHYSEYMHVFYSHICTLNSSSRREYVEAYTAENMVVFWLSTLMID